MTGNHGRSLVLAAGWWRNIALHLHAPTIDPVAPHASAC